MALSFGSSSGTSGFGSTASTPQSSSGFSFGSTTSTPSSSGFSFGNTDNKSTATPSSGFSFGNNSSSTGTGSSLFGNSSGTSTFGSSTSGNTSSGFSFGQNNSSSSTSSGFNFGSSGNTSTGGGLFGSNTGTSSSGSSLFGSNTGTTSGGSSLFGSSTGTTSGGSSLFGSSTGTSGGSSLFGTSTGTTSGGSSLFGSSTGTTGGGLFGTSTGSTGGGMFGSTTPSFNSGAQPNQQPNTQSPKDIATWIADQYNTNSPNCAFQYVLYNLVDAPQQLQRPQNVNPQLWEQGITQNPNPARLAPVVISGFEGLKARLDEHEKFMKSHQEAIEDVEKFILELKRKHEYSTIEKMEQYNRKHQELAHRLLQVIRKLEFFQSRGLSWYREEEAFHARLEHIQRELNKPTQFKGRLNELTSLVSMLDDTPQPTYTEQLEEDSLEQVRKCISRQTAGIKKLESVIKQDQEDVDTCLDALKRDM